MLKYNALILYLQNRSDPDEMATLEYYASYCQYYIPVGENPFEPNSDILYPIINNVDEVRVAGDPGYVPSNHQAVGLVAGSFYWRSFLREILPKGSNGIRVVFSGPCSKTFTYKILGGNVQYLGEGDVHEKMYDNKYVEAILGDLGRFANKTQTVYTGAPFDTEYCPVTLRVYPSEEMRDIFTSYNPIILRWSSLSFSDSCRSYLPCTTTELSVDK